MYATDMALPFYQFVDRRDARASRRHLLGREFDMTGRIQGYRNMAATQLTLSAIDVVQVPPNDTENAQAKAHAMMLAGFGAASPPMAAGAMLLLYQFAMALFIGLGPIFILCLVFDQTKELFRKWLFYGIGTLFSIATFEWWQRRIVTNHRSLSTSTK